jgi:Helix-turn-helix domain
MSNTTERVLGVAGAAELLRVHPQTLRVWLRRGLFHHAHQIPRRKEWRIPGSDIDEFLAHGSFDPDHGVSQGKIHHRGHPYHRLMGRPEGGVRDRSAR